MMVGSIDDVNALALGDPVRGLFSLWDDECTNKKDTEVENKRTRQSSSANRTPDTGQNRIKQNASRGTTINEGNTNTIVFI